MPGLVPTMGVDEDEEELQRRGIVPFMDGDTYSGNAPNVQPQPKPQVQPDPMDAGGLSPASYHGDQEENGLAPFTDNQPAPAQPAAASTPAAPIQPTAPSTLDQTRAAVAHQTGLGPEPTWKTLPDEEKHHGWRKAGDIAAAIGMGALTMNPLAGMGMYRMLSRAPLSDAQNKWNAANTADSEQLKNLKQVEAGEHGEDQIANQKMHYENQLAGAKLRADTLQAQVDEHTRHNQEVEKLNQQKADDKTRLEETARHNKTMEEIAKGNLGYRQEAAADRAEARAAREADMNFNRDQTAHQRWTEKKSQLERDQERGYKAIEDEFEKKYADKMELKDSDTAKIKALAELKQLKDEHEKAIQQRFAELGPDPADRRPSAQHLTPTTPAPHSAAATQPTAPVQPPTAAPVQHQPSRPNVPRMGDVKRVKGTPYKFDGTQWILQAGQ